MEDTKDKKKVFRKHKRRPQYILQDYIRRQKEFVWLETHIWHAKRMKMGRLWGHKLALHCNEKSWKKSYKFAEYGCILYDASYYHVLQIQGKETSLLSFLKNVVNPNESSFGNLMYRFGTHQGKTILYEYKRFPFGALAPVTFLWKPNPSGESNDRVLWIWVHAAAFDQILKEIENGINQSNSDSTIIF